MINCKFCAVFYTLSVPLSLNTSVGYFFMLKHIYYIYNSNFLWQYIIRFTSIFISFACVLCPNCRIELNFYYWQFEQSRIRAVIRISWKPYSRMDTQNEEVKPRSLWAHEETINTFRSFPNYSQPFYFATICKQFFLLLGQWWIISCIIVSLLLNCRFAFSSNWMLLKIFVIKLNGQIQSTDSISLFAMNFFFISNLLLVFVYFLSIQQHRSNCHYQCHFSNT